MALQLVFNGHDCLWEIHRPNGTKVMSDRNTPRQYSSYYMAKAMSEVLMAPKVNLRPNLVARFLMRVHTHIPGTTNRKFVQIWLDKLASNRRKKQAELRQEATAAIMRNNGFVKVNSEWVPI